VAELLSRKCEALNSSPGTEINFPLGFDFVALGSNEITIYYNQLLGMPLYPLILAHAL
jgi:hypothetical protein